MPSCRTSCIEVEQLPRECHTPVSDPLSPLASFHSSPIEWKSRCSPSEVEEGLEPGRYDYRGRRRVVGSVVIGRARFLRLKPLVVPPAEVRGALLRLRAHWLTQVAKGVWRAQVAAGALVFA